VLATAQLGAVSGRWDSQSEVFHAVVDDRALLRLGPAECAPAAAMDPLVIAPAVPTADLPRFCVEASGTGGGSSGCGGERAGAAGAKIEVICMTAAQAASQPLWGSHHRMDAGFALSEAEIERCLRSPSCGTTEPHVHPYSSTIFIRSSTSGTPSARRAAATNGSQFRIAARLIPLACE